MRLYHDENLLKTGKERILFFWGGGMQVLINVTNYAVELVVVSS